MNASYLGLGNEEPDEEEHAQAEAGEGDECTVTAPAHCHQHVRHSASNDEVEEPLGCGGECHVEATETSGRDLRHIDPADLHSLLALSHWFMLATGNSQDPSPTGRRTRRGRCKQERHSRRG